MSFKVGNQNSFYFEAATLGDIETIFELNKIHINTYEDLSQINYDGVLNWVYLKNRTTRYCLSSYYFEWEKSRLLLLS